MTLPARHGGTGRSGFLDRLLRLSGDVRAGEGASALLLALDVFLILTAYLVLKVVREALILAGGGAEVKSYSAAGQAVLLLVLVPLYGSLARRLPRRVLINWVTAFFVACLVVFFLLARLGVPLGVPFYLWVGIFNLMIVAQFWAFANDVYTTEEGKRLLPIVAFGGSVGAVVGSWLPGWLMESLGLDPLFLVAGALLLLAAAVTNVVDARERRRTEMELPDPLTSGHLPAATAQVRAATGEYRIPGDDYRKASGQLRALSRADVEKLRAEPKSAPPEPGGPGAFGLVFRSRYLLLIALLMLLLNWVNTTGEYVLGRIVTEVAAEAARGGASETAVIGSFYSGYFATVNLLALFIQLLVVARVLKYAGVRAALLVLPAIAFGGYLLMAFAPILGAVRWAKTFENATDYSLNKTTLNVLFLPTTREEKYSAKQVIDGFVVRMGDLMSAVLVFLGTRVVVLETRQFAVVCLALIAVWFVVAATVGRRYGRLAAAVP